MEATFDQYTGLRQIGDFRGLPDIPFELTDAVQVMRALVRLSLSLSLSHLFGLGGVSGVRAYAGGGAPDA